MKTTNRPSGRATTLVLNSKKTNQGLSLADVGGGLTSSGRGGLGFSGSMKLSISAPNPIRPSLKASGLACTTRALQCVSSGWPAGDFDRHAQCCLNRHTHLKWRRSYEEKSTAGEIYGFGEMLCFVGSQTDGAKTQRHPETEAFKMSAFRRHVTPRGARGDAAATSFLRNSSVTDGGTGSKSCCLRGKKNFGTGSTS